MTGPRSYRAVRATGPGAGGPRRARRRWPLSGPAPPVGPRDLRLSAGLSRGARPSGHVSGHGVSALAPAGRAPRRGRARRPPGGAGRARGPTPPRSRRCRGRPGPARGTRALPGAAPGRGRCRSGPRAGRRRRGGSTPRAAWPAAMSSRPAMPIGIRQLADVTAPAEVLQRVPEEPARLVGPALVAGEVGQRPARRLVEVEPPDQAPPGVPGPRLRAQRLQGRARAAEVAGQAVDDRQEEAGPQGLPRVAVPEPDVPALAERGAGAGRSPMARATTPRSRAKVSTQAQSARPRARARPPSSAATAPAYSPRLAATTALLQAASVARSSSPSSPAMARASSTATRAPAKSWSHTPEMVQVQQRAGADLGAGRGRGEQRLQPPHGLGLRRVWRRGWRGRGGRARAPRRPVWRRPR